MNKPIKSIVRHAWKPGISASQIAQVAKEHGDIMITSDFLTAQAFNPEKDFGPLEKGWVAIKRAPSCCDDNPQPPTVLEIARRVLDDNATVVCRVRASHPCGIKQISVYLGSLQWVRTPTGGRAKVPRARVDPATGNIEEGTEETWTRSDSTDGAPVALNAYFRYSLFKAQENVWIVRVINTCDVEATAITDEFAAPTLGPI